MLSSGKRGSHRAQEEDEKAQRDTADEAARVAAAELQQLVELQRLATETSGLMLQRLATEKQLAEEENSRLQLLATIEQQNRLAEQAQLAVKEIVRNTPEVLLTTTTTTTSTTTTTTS